jgi:hypothetical protein
MKILASEIRLRGFLCHAGTLSIVMISATIWPDVPSSSSHFPRGASVRPDSAISLDAVAPYEVPLFEQMIFAPTDLREWNSSHFLLSVLENGQIDNATFL